MVNVVLSVLLSVPWIDVVEAEVKTGKFCRKLPLGSLISHGLLGVTPSSWKSIPNPLLEKMELDKMGLEVFGLPATPANPLNAIALLAPVVVPPIILLPPRTNTPTDDFPRAAVPVTSVPI